MFMLFIVLFSVWAYSDITKFEKLLEDSFSGEAKAVASALDANIRSRDDLQNKDVTLNNIYKYIFLNPSILAISVILPNEQGGFYTYLSSNQNEVNTIPDPENATVFKNDTVNINIVAVNGQRALRALTPIHFSGQIIGTYQIDFSLAAVDQAVAKERMTTAIYYVVIVICFIVLLVLFSRTITRPIKKLMVTAQAISSGNLTKRANIKTNDEVGQLAISFNKMVDSLLTAERYSANLIQVMPTSLVVVNPDMKIRSVNETTLKLLGYEEKDLLGKKVGKIFGNGDAVGGENRIFAGEQFDSLLAKGVVRDLEMTYKNKNREDIPVDISVSVMNNEKGKVANFVIAAKDMRVYKELEEQRLESEKAKREEAEKYAKKLEGLDKIKDDFINVTAHELRTPLFPIKSQVELMLSGAYGDLSDKQKESLLMIKRNEERLHGLVADVLDVSRIESRKLQIVTGRAIIDKIVKEVVADFHPEAERRGLKLAVNVIPGLPEINADPQRIIQVVSNLINNAFKFSPDKSTIEINVSRQGEEILFQVKDQGIGLSQENIKKLFTPFFQVESGLVRERKGTGLGLAICKGIVEAHGGKIWAESAGAGQGSTFSFTLPITNSGNKENTSFVIG